MSGIQVGSTPAYGNGVRVTRNTLRQEDVYELPTQGDGVATRIVVSYQGHRLMSSHMTGKAEATSTDGRSMPVETAGGDYGVREKDASGASGPNLNADFSITATGQDKLGPLVTRFWPGNDKIQIFRPCHGDTTTLWNGQGADVPATATNQSFFEVLDPQGNVRVEANRKSLEAFNIYSNSGRAWQTCYVSIKGKSSDSLAAEQISQTSMDPTPSILRGAVTVDGAGFHVTHIGLDPIDVPNYFTLPSE